MSHQTTKSDIYAASTVSPQVIPCAKFHTESPLAKMEGSLGSCRSIFVFAHKFNHIVASQCGTTAPNPSSSSSSSAQKPIIKCPPNEFIIYCALFLATQTHIVVVEVEPSPSLYRAHHHLGRKIITSSNNNTAHVRTAANLYNSFVAVDRMGRTSP